MIKAEAIISVKYPLFFLKTLDEDTAQRHTEALCFRVLLERMACAASRSSSGARCRATVTLC